MPNRSKPMHTKEIVISAIKKRKGKLYLVAGDLNVTTQTLRNYAKRWPEVAVAIREAKGRMLDVAESKLYAAIEKGHAWAICFFLKTQGKKRGYVERYEKRKDEVQPDPRIKEQKEVFLDALPVELAEQILECMERKKEEIESAKAVARASESLPPEAHLANIIADLKESLPTDGSPYAPFPLLGGPS